MITTIYSCATVALESKLVECEVEFSKGEPLTKIVGLADTAVKEAGQRIMSAIRNSALDYPYKNRITINLAPAHLNKVGSFYDLAMAMGILLHQSHLEFQLKNKLFLGELGLDGKLRAIKGIIPAILFAKENGFEEVFFPYNNLEEAKLVKNIKLYPVRCLKEIYEHFISKNKLQFYYIKNLDIVNAKKFESFDFKYIKGQSQAKRVLEIAALGGHNVRFYGPPGSGKSFMAKAFNSILSPMSEEEILELTKIYSLAGLLNDKQRIINYRPFRAPHHTISSVALLGGGRIPQAGEVTLAHRGVLFLDEFLEFPRFVLEALRQPLEDGYINIARANGHLFLPAQFTLIVAQNPCPCGYYGDPNHQCICSQQQINNYQRKASGPLMDRIDLHVNVSAVKFDDLLNNQENNIRSSKEIREHLVEVRKFQSLRYKKKKILQNANLNNLDIKKYCIISNEDIDFLKKSAEQIALSARAYFRVLRVARSIADLEFSLNIKRKHLIEALQYRTF